MIKILFFSLTILLTSCAVKQNTLNNNHDQATIEKYQHYEKTNRGDVIIFTYKHKATAQMSEEYLDVVVYNIVKDKEIYTDHLRAGSLEWIDENTFKANYTPGNPEVHKHYFYYYNIKTQVKSFQSPHKR